MRVTRLSPGGEVVDRLQAPAGFGVCLVLLKVSGILTETSVIEVSAGCEGLDSNRKRQRYFAELRSISG